MFATENFIPGAVSLEAIKETIFSLEQEAFGDKAFTEKEMTADFTNKNTVVVLLKEKETDKIIGFMYARPIEEVEPERIAEKGETAYLWDIVIKEEYRGRHLAGSLTAALEDELRKRNYVYMELDARTANNYAANVAKVYKDRIIKSEPHDSIWGPQVFFRIKL